MWIYYICLLSRSLVQTEFHILEPLSKGQSKSTFIHSTYSEMDVMDAMMCILTQNFLSFNMLCCLLFQEDFYALVDWAYKCDPLRCISMHGITERYLSGQKADTAGFVRLLLDDIETRISLQFSKVHFSDHSILSCPPFFSGYELSVVLLFIVVC